MKVLQINTWYFTLFENLLAFLEQEDADVILLQEVGIGVMNGWDGTDPRAWLEQLWYHLAYCPIYWVVQQKDDQNLIWEWWIAVMSKYPISDIQHHYIPYLWWYQTYTPEELHLDVRGKHQKSYDDKLKSYIFERTTPSPVLQVTLDRDWKKITCMTTHFKVSEQCTMTYQMLLQAEYVRELIQDITWPIVFWGDLNINSDAIVLDPIREELDQITTGAFNSLNPRVHPWFKWNIPPEGYGVDHLFQRWCNVVSWRVRDDVDVSDHLPIECILN